MQDRFPQRSWYQEPGSLLFATTCTYLFASKHVPIPSQQTCTILFAAKLYQSGRGKHAPIFSRQTCTICSRQDLKSRTQDQGPRTQKSLYLKQVFWKVIPKNILSIPICTFVQCAHPYHIFRTNAFTANKDQHCGNLEVQTTNFGTLLCSKIIEFYLKCVHTARYELILKLDEALWLSIVCEPLLTPNIAHTIKYGTKNIKIPKRLQFYLSSSVGPQNNVPRCPLEIQQTALAAIDLGGVYLNTQKDLRESNPLEGTRKLLWVDAKHGIHANRDAVARHGTVEPQIYGMARHGISWHGKSQHGPALKILTRTNSGTECACFLGAMYCQTLTYIYCVFVATFFLTLPDFVLVSPFPKHESSLDFQIHNEFLDS